MQDYEMLIDPSDVALMTLTLKYWIDDAPVHMTENERKAFKQARFLYHKLSELLEVGGYPSMRTV